MSAEEGYRKIARALKAEPTKSEASVSAAAAAGGGASGGAAAAPGAAHAAVHAGLNDSHDAHGAKGNECGDLRRRMSHELSTKYMKQGLPVCV